MPCARTAAFALAACNGKASPAVEAAGRVGEIPTETAGPFPADGTNGPNALTQSGVQRSDIRSNPTEAVLRLVRDTAWAVGKSAGKVRAHARKHW